MHVDAGEGSRLPRQPITLIISKLKKSKPQDRRAGFLPQRPRAPGSKKQTNTHHQRSIYEHQAPLLLVPIFPVHFLSCFSEPGFCFRERCSHQSHSKEDAERLRTEIRDLRSFRGRNSFQKRGPERNSAPGRKVGSLGASAGEPNTRSKPQSRVFLIQKEERYTESHHHLPIGDNVTTT